ncbi:MAG TPA: DUF6174 domain-containing protein [Gemmatimonadaceae bacterium]|nr:DUF6174 domain-containing protein [Gemmatimonadaceae bacterium]
MKRALYIVLASLGVGCSRTNASADLHPDQPVGQKQPATIGATISPVPQLPAIGRLGWSTRQRDSALAVLEHHRSIWAAFRPRAYRYWQEASCFCMLVWPGPHVITVRNGHVVSVTDTSGRSADTTLMRSGAELPAGIDALFDRMVGSIRDTSMAGVMATYDPSVGYPTHVTFDRDFLVNDDEFSLTIRHVRAVQQR